MLNYKLSRRSLLKSIGTLPGATLFYNNSFATVDMAVRDELVKFLEAAPRDQIIEKLVERIRNGLDYDDLLAALSHAAARNVQPFPDVGFKYHNVMVIQSLYLAGKPLSGAERWLPLLWHADYFKRSQEDEIQRTGWHLQTVRIDKFNAANARRELLTAIERWDSEAADRAVVQLLTTTSPMEIMALLMPYHARDYRSLGHKPIAGANAHRLLRVNKDYGAEAILRSTVAAIQNPEGDTDPYRNDHRADRYWQENRQRINRFPAQWREGKQDWTGARHLLASLRTTDAEEASEAVVQSLQDGIAPKMIWEAMLGTAGEIMLQKGSFAALHALTMTNALYYLYQQSAGETQQILLLQSASFLALFRRDAGYQHREITIDQLEPLACDHLEECFAALADDRFKAIRLTLGYLNSTGDSKGFIRLVRRTTLERVNNSHDYKLSEAMIEDYRVMRAPWRNAYLATMMFYVNGPRQSMNPLVREARELLS